MTFEFLRGKRPTLVVMGLAVVAWVQSCAGGWEHRMSDAAVPSCGRLASRDGSIFWQSCTMGSDAAGGLAQGGRERLPEGVVVGPDRRESDADEHDADDAGRRVKIRCRDVDVTFAAPEPWSFFQVSSSFKYERTRDHESGYRTVHAAIGYVLVILLGLLSLVLGWFADLRERRAAVLAAASPSGTTPPGLVPQPTPDVSRADVERIVRRDFEADRVAKVLARLDRIDAATPQPERARARTQLAVLKLAAGDTDRLKARAATAKADPRDVIAPAEYPEYLRRWDEIDSLPPEEQQRIIDGDHAQYERWLRA